MMQQANNAVRFRLPVGGKIMLKMILAYFEYKQGLMVKALSWVIFNFLPVIIFHYGMLLAVVEWLVCMKNYAYPSLPQLNQTQ